VLCQKGEKGKRQTMCKSSKRFMVGEDNNVAELQKGQERPPNRESLEDGQRWHKKRLEKCSSKKEGL